MQKQGFTCVLVIGQLYKQLHCKLKRVVVFPYLLYNFFHFPSLHWFLMFLMTPVCQNQLKSNERIEKKKKENDWYTSNSRECFVWDFS
jgi:hypothetical protein